MNPFCRLIYRLFITVAFVPAILQAQAPIPGEPLPPWQPGMLDLHHINTGMGNAAFYIFPDGTTMLFDAGEQHFADSIISPAHSVAHPNASKHPYEWIAAYINIFGPTNNKGKLDYAAISHFHDDHFGSWYPRAPLSTSGNFRLTGITGVGSLVPIHYLFDRGKEFPVPMIAPTQKIDSNDLIYTRSCQNYESFIADQKPKGLIAEPLKAGSRTQITLSHDPAAYPDFYVQNIKSGGHLWTGKDTGTHNILPLMDPGHSERWPDENSLSLVLTIHYGPFVYYSGGDIAGHLNYGEPPWKDVETPVATVVGEVDVATMDHHGNRNSLNEFFVKTLKPRVWIDQVWSADHPGQDVLIRATNTSLYSGPRDFFATNMLEANRIVIGPRIDRAYKSMQGHILVRVTPGGREYYIIILEDQTENPRIKKIFGPYQSKIKS